MFLIGLTGGIATGKSTAANIFKEHNIPVVDSDVIARQSEYIQWITSLIVTLSASNIFTNVLISCSTRRKSMERNTRGFRN